MNKAAVLSELRQKTGSKLLQDREMWKAPQLESGVARGIVAELLGNARIDWLISLFKMNPDTLIFWCKSDQQANPVALKQRGISLERIKFIKSVADLQQPLRMALESQLYPFIVAPNRFDEVRIFQRFHLLAEKSKSTLFLLGKKDFSLAWPIALQLEINNTSDEFDIYIHKQKHGVNE